MFKRLHSVLSMLIPTRALDSLSAARAGGLLLALIFLPTTPATGDEKQAPQPDKTVHQPDKTVHQPDKTVHQPDKMVHQPDKTVHQPELFAPGVVSKPDRHEFGVVVTADDSRVFFGVDTGGRHEIWQVDREGEGWGTERPLLQDKEFNYHDPALDPEEQRLYFISNRPPVGTPEGTAHNADIWYLERRDEGWSAPIHAGPVINTTADEYYTSFTDDGSLYFASNVGAERKGDYDIYFSRNALSAPEKPVRLGPGVNTGAYEADVFVAPDGSYLIFAASRRSGLGRGDLYMSLRGEDRTFEKAKSLGAPINTEGHELCPFVSRDGRFFYYTSRQDIYRIDTSGLGISRTE